VFPYLGYKYWRAFSKMLKPFDCDKDKCSLRHSPDLCARAEPMMLKCGLLALALLVSTPLVAQGARPITVFAAASLKTALDDSLARWQQQGGATAVAAYAASSALARQISSGAPADLFFSADVEWMDYLQQRSLIRTDSRVTLLRNRLVLIAATGHQGPVIIDASLDLRSLLKGNRLAMGETASVPAGKYGKAALTHLGLWPSLAANIAGVENVRAALTLVARGETPLGIVYQTDATAEPKVAIIGIFPENSHPRILYPLALTATAQAQAAGLLGFLTSPEAAVFFTRQGFSVLTPGERS
jgi:molybdate transport system substrate-binding protein